MSRARSLANLLTDTRQRADMQNQTAFITDVELTEYINESLAELYELLVLSRGADYYEALYQFSTVANLSVYALPASFFQLLSVESIVNGTDRIVLRPFNRHDRAYLVSSTPGWMGQPLYYRLRADNIELLPIAAGAITIFVYFIPAPVRLAISTDAFDGVAGWEEYAIVDAARKCATKEENWELVQSLTADRERLKSRIQDIAKSRDAFMPPKFVNVRNEWGIRSRRASRW